GATRVGNRPKERKKRFERLQGDPRMIRSPHTDSDFFPPRNPPPPVAPQNVESCCIWDSVQSVEQPWLRYEPRVPPAGRRFIEVFRISQRLVAGCCGRSTLADSTFNLDSAIAQLDTAG